VTHHFTHEIENIEFYDITKERICTTHLIFYFLHLKIHSSWRVSSVLLISLSINNSVVNFKCVVLHLILIVWLKWIRKCKFFQISDEKWFFCKFWQYNWILDQQIPSRFLMKGFICFTDFFIYKQFSCHEFIKNLFSKQILIKLTISNSVWSDN
jgi:hypothetical protein